jgi:DNA-binding PadR family transcriptional regulator
MFSEMPRLSVKHYKMTDAQRTVLCQIGRGGNSSIASLTKTLDKNYSDVSGSLNILKDAGFVKQIGEHKGRGKAEKFYVLTDLGIKELIKLKIPIKDFWRMIFFVFDNPSNHTHLSVSLDEIINEYQRNVLMLQMEHTPLFFTELHNRDILSGYISDVQLMVFDFLKLFAINGPLILNELYRDHKSYFISNGYVQDESFKTIDLMLSKELLVKVKLGDKIKFRLSHFGLLYYLYHLNNVFTKENEIKCREDLRSVIENHTSLLPLVFEKWNRLKMIKEEKFLLEIFSRLYFDDSQGVQDNINLLESRLLANILYSMDVMYRNKIKEFTISGIQILHESLEKKGYKIQIENVERVLKQFQENNEFKIKTQTSPIKGKNHSIKISATDSLFKIVKMISKFNQNLPHSEGVASYASMNDKIDDWYKNYWDMSESSLQNIISFQFYSLFRYNIEQEKWDDFLSKDQNLKEWYFDWLNAIIKFEEDNLKSIKAMSDI